VSKGRPEKERKEGQKLFGKKKELLLLVVKKEQKQPRPRNSEKKEKKRLVAPQKKATPRLDSVFKNSVTHSFFSREAYNDLL
tara:strand:+ start:95 stop:340 length:246 start_codon:yes stop_codon:yes gene_type:complete